MKKFTEKNLFDDVGVGVNGNKIRKMKLLYVDADVEPSLCDMCNELKPCAHIDDITGKMVSVICKDCLQLILNCLNTPENE